MGYIIRNRLLPGNSTVDGNNPFSIQGHPVSTRVVGQQEGIKDYLDLTDQILTIPRELSHYRLDSPLMGGSVTVKNQSGPVNDYLATQYLTKKPPQGYMGPENRPAEIPEITIGKAGTFDVKLACSIWTQTKLLTFKNADDLKKGLISGVYYNLTDFDDPNAPAMPVKIPDVGYKLQVISPTPAETLAKIPKCARIVGFVKLLANGIKAAEDARAEFQAAGGNPCEIRQEVGWFEIQVVEKIDDKEIRVLGATYDDTEKSFVMNRSPLLPGHARVPPERIWIEIPTATDTNKSLPSVFVPVWDIAKIETTVDKGVTHRTTVTYKLDGGDKTLAIDTVLDAGLGVTTHYRRVPMRPIFTKDYTNPNPALESHPFFPDTVFPYVRIDAFRDDGFHYAAFADTVKIADPIAKWAPNTAASATIEIGTTVKYSARLPLGWVSGAVVPKPYLVPSSSTDFEIMANLNWEVGTADGQADNAEYSISKGTLPSGVGIDKTTGAITGKWESLKPADRKSHKFTVTAKSPTKTEDVEYTINVKSFLVPGGSKTLTKNGSLSWKITTLTTPEARITYSTKDPIPLSGFAISSDGVIEANWAQIPSEDRGSKFTLTIDAYLDAKTILDSQNYEVFIAIETSTASAVEPNPQPLVCTRITAKVLRKPCQGPEDLEVLAWLSDGSSEVLSMDEYAIVGTAAGVMTLALASDPSIVAKVKIS